MSSIPLPPGLRVNGFSMAPAAVTRAHSGPFGGDGAEAVVDLLQDRWRASFSTTATTPAESGAVEAWIAAQRGGANTTPLHHFARPFPRGTLGRQHAVYGLLADAAQGADAVQLATVPGATLLAGDMVGVSGLLLQCAADCVADAQGAITVPLVNRLRRALTGLRRASTATFVDAGGVLQTAAVNVARFQPDPLLVNRLLHSQALNTAPWAGCTVSPAAELYNGASPFWSVAKATVVTSENIGQNAKAVIAGEAGTITVALLAGTVAQCSVGILHNNPTGWGLDSESTAAVLEGPGVISARGGSLCTITGLSATVPTLVRITRTFQDVGTPTFRVYPGVHTSTTIGDAVKVTRAQYQMGSTATAYTPTTTAVAGPSQLLVEGAATNLCTHSGDLSQAIWVGGTKSAAAENYRGVPFWTVAKAISGLAETVSQIMAAPVPAGSTVTLTVALLAGTSSQIQLGVFDLTAGSWGLNADSSREIIEGPGVLSNQVGGSTNVTGLSSTVPTLLRITRLFVTAGVPRVIVYMDTGASSTIGASNKMTRFQLELGTTPSSYIPTTTAAITRAADVIDPAEWNKPTRPFRLASRAGVRHAPGYAEGLALDFVEDLTP